MNLSYSKQPGQRSQILLSSSWVFLDHVNSISAKFTIKYSIVI
jgi:hypothetical protein